MGQGKDASTPCQAGEASVSVDVRGWGVADGAVALLTEASAHVAGGVRQLRVAGCRLHWSQPAESVQLLELAPEPLQRSSLYAGPAAAAAPRPNAPEEVAAATAAARPRMSQEADAGSCGDDGTCAEDGACADDGTCAADAAATCAEAATCAAHRDTSSSSSSRSSRSSSRSGGRSKLAAQCDAASAPLPSAPPGWPSLKRPAAFHPHRPVTCGSSRPQRLFSFDLSPLRGEQAVGAAAFVLLELHGQAFEGGATALVLYADSGRAGEEPRPLGSWRRSDQPCSDQGRCSGTLLRKSQLTLDITDAAHGLARRGTERAQRLDVLASCEHERGKRSRSSRASLKAAALRVLHRPLRD